MKIEKSIIRAISFCLDLIHRKREMLKNNLFWRLATFVYGETLGTDDYEFLLPPEKTGLSQREIEEQRLAYTKQLLFTWLLPTGWSFYVTSRCRPVKRGTPFKEHTFSACIIDERQTQHPVDLSAIPLVLCGWMDQVDRMTTTRKVVISTVAYGTVFGSFLLLMAKISTIF